MSNKTAILTDFFLQENVIFLHPSIQDQLLCGDTPQTVCTLKISFNNFSFFPESPKAPSRERVKDVIYTQRHTSHFNTTVAL